MYYALSSRSNVIFIKYVFCFLFATVPSVPARYSFPAPAIPMEQHIKNKFFLSLMSVYAEIMDCYFCIYLLQDSKYLMMHLIELASSVITGS